MFHLFASTIRVSPVFILRSEQVLIAMEGPLLAHTPHLSTKLLPLSRHSGTPHLPTTSLTSTLIDGTLPLRGEEPCVIEASEVLDSTGAPKPGRYTV